MRKLRKKHENDFWYNLNNHDSMATRVEKESVQCQEECKYSPQQRVNMLCNHRETQKEAAAQQAKYELLLLPKANQSASKMVMGAVFSAVMAVAVLAGLALARYTPWRLSTYRRVQPG